MPKQTRKTTQRGKPNIEKAARESLGFESLRPGQKDTDSLPPYDVLDPILEAYVEDDRTFEEIVRLGYDPETVRRVLRLVDLSEYKRRQAPPGIKITERAFGRDRRLPLTSAYRGQPSPYAAGARDERAAKPAGAGAQ